MERIDIVIKTGLGFFGTLFSVLVDGMGVLFAVLVVFMFADYITGMIAAMYEKSFDVRKGFSGFVKKLYVIILIGLIALLERMVFHTNHLADGVAFAYLAIEFMSIIENGHRLGAPVPAQVMDIFEKFKSRDEKKDETA